MDVGITKKNCPRAGQCFGRSATNYKLWQIWDFPSCFSALCCAWSQQPGLTSSWNIMEISKSCLEGLGNICSWFSNTRRKNTPSFSARGLLWALRLESFGKQAWRGKTGNSEFGLRKLILLQSLGWKMASARNKCMGQKDTKGEGHAANTGRNAGEVIRKVYYIH